MTRYTKLFSLAAGVATLAAPATAVAPSAAAVAPAPVAAIVATDISLTDGEPSVVIHNPGYQDIMTLDLAVSLPQEGEEPTVDPAVGGTIEYRDEDGNLVEPAPAEGIDRSGLTREETVGDGTIEYRDEEGNLVEPAPAEGIDRSDLARDGVTEEPIIPISAEVNQSSPWPGRIIGGLLGLAAGTLLGRVWQTRAARQVVVDNR